MICSFVFLLLASGADNLAAAKSALENGLPSVAVENLETSLSAKTENEAVLTLARAYVDDGKPERALELLKTHPAGKAGDFWLAQAYAALGRPEEALQKYRESRGEPSLSEESLLGEVRMLRSLGRNQEMLDTMARFPVPDSSLSANAFSFEKARALIALQRPREASLVLEAVVPADSREKSLRNFLMAESLARVGDDMAAMALYRTVQPLDAEMAVDVADGIALSLVRTGQLPAAENLLEEFLSKNPDLPGLERVFSELDAVYAGQPTASSGELKRWADDPEPSSRKKLAEFYLARFEARLGREDRVEALLEKAVEDSGKDSFSDAAELELARLRLKQGRPGEAAALLPPRGISPLADFLHGLALAGSGSALSASEFFLSAATEESLAEPALYNAAVCELMAGKSDSPACKLLEEKFPGTPRLEKLRLLNGYSLARKGDGGAEQVFEGLSHAGDPRVAAAAELALAEWKYETGDRSGALEDLRRVSTASGEAAGADALAVFLADDGRSNEAAIATAEKYLKEHPGTAAEAEVMMKLGELLFRKGDFAGARVQFESLAKKYPGTALEYPALFLAAQSASRLQTSAGMNDAMLLFEEVASSDNSLALRARFEQAVLQNVLGKPTEAIVILDRIVASNGSAEMKSAALVEKGKTLYGLGASDPKSYRAAVDVWKQVAEDPVSAPEWRNQALSRMGAAYEKLGDTDSAVVAYYEVIKDGKPAPQAFFWFYKAGFAAARLLESSKRWDQAIRIYEMIAAAGGPRSAEAVSRINKIRLENFLWDETPGG